MNKHKPLNTSKTNNLYFGDNLDIMKSIIQDRISKYLNIEFIDLIYIDPPFNSNRDYSVFFESDNNNRQYAQKVAFTDTWSDYTYRETLDELDTLDNGMYSNLVIYLNTLKDVLHVDKPSISYLSTMALRVVYMYKLLKQTGSFYLHCDPTMSHYLKIVLDNIFGRGNFRNEIVWKRKEATGSIKSIGNAHDVIFYYVKDIDKFKFNIVFTKYDEKSKKRYKFNDDNGKGLYAKEKVIANPGLTGGGATYKYKDYYSQRWLLSYEKIKELDDNNEIVWSSTGRPYRKLFLNRMNGLPIVDVWNDVVNARGNERLGYPTQKPISLLDRIIQASSNEGDIVADFFCGCGTTVISALKNDRQFIGCDISHISISLINKRINEDELIKGKSVDIEIKGIPKDIEGAKQYFNISNSELNSDNKISHSRRLQFEEYIIEYLLNGAVNEKRGSIPYDGYVNFKAYNYQSKREIKATCYIECKSGNVSKNEIRAFSDTITKLRNSDNNNSNTIIIGLFVCFKDMITKGYEDVFRELGMSEFDTNIPIIELITLDSLLDNIYPMFYNKSINTTFKGNQGSQRGL